FYPTTSPQIPALSLHDALPIWGRAGQARLRRSRNRSPVARLREIGADGFRGFSCSQFRSSTPSSGKASPRLFQNPATCCTIASRSEEHTSELQSRSDLVCRLLL